MGAELVGRQLWLGSCFAASQIAFVGDQGEQGAAQQAPFRVGQAQVQQGSATRLRVDCQPHRSKMN
eukprot:scaffold171018_cov12-Tisochrysis_lutea.AAC.1